MASSSSNKPGAVHYSLIFFVMMTIVLGVTTYMFHREYSDASVAQKTADDKAQTANTMFAKTDSDMQELRKVLGKTDQPQVVDPTAPNSPTTVVGVLRTEMGAQGQLQETTYSGTLAKVREALNTTIAERDSKVAELNAREKELLAIQSRYQSQTDDHQKKYRDAEGEKRKVIAERDELLQAKDREVAELRGQYNQVQVELEQAKEQSEKERMQFQNEREKLIAINNKIRDELDEIKKESFEVADGTVRRVDNTSRMVWLDLGEADFLKPRMTFSVYNKDTPGVARTTADIKGKVEVTRIIDAHLAEASIIEEDLYRPMSPGDLVYTPLWSPGRAEKFAIVGAIDLDGDGESDRTLFRQEMAVRGAEIVDEVDDEGNRPSPGINETVKYVVMGSLPDPTEAVLTEDQDRMKKILGHATEMRNESRLYGVRIIPLSAFLDFIGYKPKRRLFRPGQNRPYTLKSGAASVGIDESAVDRSSAGQVSGSYSRSKRLPPQSSSGPTQKVFGGNK
ncbi:MAG: hypothetical protein SH850_08555 [Planctomycetaceae bacterium]|nr:hypothetical protein [Planctomycetaceae bacterium]